MSIINESEIDEIIKHDGLDDVLRYILETYSSKINYDTICDSLDYVDLLRELKQKKPYEQDFNNEVLGLFSNKELAEYAGISIIDEFKSKDVLNYMDLSFDESKTLKNFEVEVIKTYLSNYAYYNYNFGNNNGYHNKKDYFDHNNVLVHEYEEIKDLLLNYVEHENIPRIIDIDDILKIYFEYDVIKKENLFYTTENHFKFIHQLISNFNIFLNNTCNINELFYKDEDYKNSFYYHESLISLEKLKDNIIKTLDSNNLIITEFINLYSKLYSNINLNQTYKNPMDSDITITNGLYDKNIAEIANSRVLGLCCDKNFKTDLFKELEDFFEKSFNSFDEGLYSDLNDLKDMNSV